MILVFEAGGTRRGIHLVILILSLLFLFPTFYAQSYQHFIPLDEDDVGESRRDGEGRKGTNEECIIFCLIERTNAAFLASCNNLTNFLAVLAIIPHQSAFLLRSPEKEKWRTIRFEGFLAVAMEMK